MTIEIIQRIYDITKHANASNNPNEDSNEALLIQIQTICDNFIIDYKVNRRLEQDDKPTSKPLPRTQAD